MTLVLQSQTLLLVSLVVNLAAIAHIGTRGGDGFRIRLLILVNYLVDNIVSGIVHVFRISHSRGFYEALAGNPTGHGTGLMPASWAALLGILALWAGCAVQRTPKDPSGARVEVSPTRLFSIAAASRRTAAVVAVVLIAICGAAWVKVISVMAGSTGRVIAVGGGNARYVTLSGWLQWGVTLAAMVLLSRRQRTASHVWNAVVMLLSVAAIVATLAWSGGRSTLLFACLPLLAVVLPHTGKVKWPMLIVGALAMGGIVWYLTVQRAATSSGSTDIAGLFDWQWGRFSMGAWAARYVSLHGTVGGETFLSSLVAVPDAFLHFVGLQLPFHLRSMVMISGASLLGSAEQIYVVPGFTAELIINFGLAGVAVGYLALGLAAGWLADRYRASRFEMERLLVIFIATTVVFSTIVAAAEAFFLGIVMDGIPLMLLVVWERVRVHKDITAAAQGAAGSGLAGSGATVAHDPW